MKRLAALDLEGRAALPRAGWALLVLAALPAAWQGWLAWEDAARVQQVQAALARLQAPARASSASAMSAADIQRHARIDALAAYLATPWAPLLDLFESRAGRGVTLVRFAPDATTGRVEITGRAAATAAVSEYLLALERDPRLAGVMLQRTQQLSEAAGAQMEFTVAARWLAAAEEKRP